MNTGKEENRRFRKWLIFVVILAILLIIGAISLFVLLYTEPGCSKSVTPGLKLRKDANELEMCLIRYEESYGSYPSEEQGLMALVEKPTTGNIPKNYKPIVKNKKAIQDPWGTIYVLKSKGDDLQIITLGKDKKVGGEGKNKDFNILDYEEYPEEFLNK